MTTMESQEFITMLPGDEQPATLEPLAQAAKTGDTDAFAELYKATYREIEGSMRRSTDPDTAQDLAQTAFLKAFEKIESYQSENFKAWIYRIAANSLIDMVRHNQRVLSLQPKIEIYEGGQGSTSRYHDAEAEALTRLITEDTDVLIKSANLPSEQKEAVILFHVFDYSYKEIAAHQGVPIGTVQSRINRGLRGMRKQYGITAEKSKSAVPYQAPVNQANSF